MEYRLQIVSDVIRDGLGVELIDQNKQIVAEVFRADTEKDLLFSAFKPDIPFVEIEKLVLVARQDLVAFEDGSQLPDRI